MTLTSDRRAFLRAVSCGEKALARGDAESALAWAQMAAGFAWRVHVGVWRDDRLEALVAEAGRRARAEGHADAPLPVVEADVVFVATGLYAIGGHTRVVRTWAEALASAAKVAFAVTGAGADEAPPAWADPVVRPSRRRGLAQRIDDLATWLDAVRPAVVVLVHNPNDVVAVGAMAALVHRPRVVLFNHADHTFWLGATVADRVIHFRNLGAEVSSSCRGLPDGAVVPLAETPSGRTSGVVPAQAAAVPDDAVMSLTLTGHTKTRGDPEWNYFDALAKLLRARPGLWHVMVSTHPRWRQWGLRVRHGLPRRFVFMGPVAAPGALYERCDFIIESFPMVGGMVRIEAALYGKPLLAVRNLRFPLLSDTDTIPFDYPLASTTEEVVRNGMALCDSANLRQSLAGRLRQTSETGTRDWQSLLRALLLDDRGWRRFGPGPEQDSAYIHAWARPIDRPRLLAGIALPILASTPLPGRTRAGISAWCAARLAGAWQP